MEEGNRKTKKHRLSVVSVYHYIRLLYRSAIFLAALVWYIASRLSLSRPIPIRGVSLNPILTIIWVVFMIEMALRFFPSNYESPGCQKQFSKNYIPTGRTDVKLHDNNAVMIVALAWIIFNAAIGAGFMVDLFDEGILLLICLIYSICDMICILFFCPFQTWFLKNRCCSSCRIYNWDYAMMFTPLFFIPGIYTWSLLAAAVVLLLRWEITIWLYPERFSENTNDYLKCSGCSEKLCTHKKQLTQFRRELKIYAEKRIEQILSGKRKK